MVEVPENKIRQHNYINYCCFIGFLLMGIYMFYEGKFWYGILGLWLSAISIPDIDKWFSNTLWPIIKVILIYVMVIGGLWFLVAKGIDILRPKAWTLFVYSSSTPNTEYQKARIDGYRTQTECLEKGLLQTNTSGSYECGYDCKFKSDYGIDVCSKICVSRGCRD